MKKLLALIVAAWCLGPVGLAHATDVVKRLPLTPWTGSRPITGVVDGAESREPLSGGADRYIVRAHRGQHLVIAGVSDNNAIVRVWDKAYEKGVIFTDQTSALNTDIRLPLDGDYIILVSAAPGVQRLQYHYTVTIH